MILGGVILGGVILTGVVFVRVAFAGMAAAAQAHGTGNNSVFETFDFELDHDGLLSRLVVKLHPKPNWTPWVFPLSRARANCPAIPSHDVKDGIFIKEFI